MSIPSSWQFGWPADPLECLDLGLLCAHDLSLASSACSSWRTVVGRPSLSSALCPMNSLECAALRGSSSLVSHLVSSLLWDARLFPDALDCAAESGSADCVRFLISAGCVLSDRVCLCAARGGSVDVVRTLVGDCGCQFDARAFAVAAAGGRLEMLKCLHEEFGYSLEGGRGLCETAATAGRLEVLAYLLEGMNECDGIERGGYLQCLVHCWQKGATWIKECVETATCASGSVEAWDRLRERGFRGSPRACSLAARGGHLEMLTKLHEEIGVPWDAMTCEAAAEMGHVQCLAYAHERGCPWDVSSICRVAAASGSSDCLRYCIEQGCELSDPHVCSLAATKSLELLRIAHESGCPWDKSSCTSAAEADKLEVLKYLHERGCPWYRDIVLSVSRSPKMLQYLLEEGSSLPYILWTDAARNRSSSSCLSWAHKHGCQLSAGFAKLAAQCGSVVCVKYCLDHGIHIDTRDCLGSDRDSVAVLRYLCASLA